MFCADIGLWIDSYLISSVAIQCESYKEFIDKLDFNHKKAILRANCLGPDIIVKIRLDEMDPYKELSLWEKEGRITVK